MAHPLGHLNLLAILSSLLLLTLAAAYACLLCIGKKNHPTGCWKNASHSLPPCLSRRNNAPPCL